MNTTVRNQALRLIQKEQPVCLSILMPTHRAGREIQQDRIRFKNLLRQAEEKLNGAGVRKREIKALIAPLKERIDDHHFWRHQLDGLAVYRTSELMEWIQTLWTLPELCVTGQHFHVKPLLRAGTPERDFLVLSVTAAGIRLFHGSQEAIDDITPEGLAEIFAGPEGDRRTAGLQAHSAGNEMRLHGPGSPADLEEANLENRFRRADQELSATVTAAGFPVILAGVEQVQAVYRSTTSFPELLADTGITGNVEGLPPQEIWNAAWPIAEARFRESEQAAITDFHDRAGRGLTSTDLATILTAATEGRVERLFVATGRQVWGSFDPEKRQGKVHQVASPGDEDLLNTAALFSLSHGAQLHALNADLMPEGCLAAAAFRY